jgi:hypothetical protein
MRCSCGRRHGLPPTCHEKGAFCHTAREWSRCRILAGSHSCSYGGNRDGLHTIFKRRAIRASLASVGGVYLSGFESLPLTHFFCDLRLAAA